MFSMAFENIYKLISSTLKVSDKYITFIFLFNDRKEYHVYESKSWSINSNKLDIFCGCRGINTNTHYIRFNENKKKLYIL